MVYLTLADYNDKVEKMQIMYCGKGSIFRKDFAGNKVKKKIEEEISSNDIYINDLYEQINHFWKKMVN